MDIGKAILYASTPFVYAQMFLRGKWRPNAHPYRTIKEKEEEVEVAASDYEYLVDTDVYTSVFITGGEHSPDNPVTVRFYIKNKVYTVSNIVYPDGGSQLVWCRWHTPNTEQTVNIKVTVTGGA